MFWVLNIRSEIRHAEFSAGQAADISGVNAALQRHWRRRGLLPDIAPGKKARFGPGEVLGMMIMKAFSDSNISIKGARLFTQTATDVANALLYALPGAVKIVADAGCSPGIVQSERRTLEEWRNQHIKRRYLFMPLPEQENSAGTIIMYQREDLSDLAALLDGNGFHGLLIDTDAIARAFLARALQANKRPLQTITLTRALNTRRA